MAWTSPSTWVASAVLTAAQLNQQLRDNLKAIGDPWTAWTPAWTGATTDPVIGDGTITGGVIEAGKLTHFWAEIVAGPTTTYGSGTYSISLPVTESGHRWSFTGVLRDTSASATYLLIGERAVSGALTLRTSPTTAGDPLRSVNPTTPFTMANGDSIFISGTLEAA